MGWMRAGAWVLGVGVFSLGVMTAGSAWLAKERADKFAKAAAGMKASMGGSWKVEPGVFSTMAVLEKEGEGGGKLEWRVEIDHGPFGLGEKETPFKAEAVMIRDGKEERLLAMRGGLMDGGAAHGGGALESADWGPALAAMGVKEAGRVWVSGGKEEWSFDPETKKASWRIEGARVEAERLGASFELREAAQAIDLGNPLAGSFEAKIGGAKWPGGEMGEASLRSESEVSGGKYGAKASLMAKGIYGAGSPRGQGGGRVEAKMSISGLEMDPLKRLDAARAKIEGGEASPSDLAEMRDAAEALAAGGMDWRIEKLEVEAAGAKASLSGGIWLTPAGKAGGAGLTRQLGWSLKAEASGLSNIRIEDGGPAGAAARGYLQGDAFSLDAKFSDGWLEIGGAREEAGSLMIRRALEGLDMRMGLMSPGEAALFEIGRSIGR